MLPAKEKVYVAYYLKNICQNVEKYLNLDYFDIVFPGQGVQSYIPGFYIQVDSLVHLFHFPFTHLFVFVFTKTSPNFFPVFFLIYFFKNILSWSIFNGTSRYWVILNRAVKLFEDGPDITSIHIETAESQQ